MRLSQPDFGAALPVDGYGPGFFRIGGLVHEGPALLTGRAVHPWGGLDDLAPLLALSGQIDVLIVGLGDTMRALPPAFQAALDGAAIGVEPMATPAAARGFNVLLGEGRRVGAALLPVGAPA